MARIEKYLAPGEEIIFRAQFGFARLVAELVVIALATFVGLMFGPMVFAVWPGLLLWLYGERRVQKVVVTNRRLIHKKPWRAGQFNEMALNKIESVKDNGLQLIVRGSGATKITLPPFLKNRAALRGALLAGR